MGAFDNALGLWPKCRGEYLGTPKERTQFLKRQADELIVRLADGGDDSHVKTYIKQEQTQLLGISFLATLMNRYRVATQMTVSKYLSPSSPWGFTSIKSI